MLTELEIGQLFVRLKEKANAYNKTEKKVYCKECGAEMIKRKSKWGNHKYWWGCSRFPLCKNTKR